jgi:membrane-bound lytic murein transglycosylase D
VLRIPSLIAPWVRVRFRPLFGVFTAVAAISCGRVQTLPVMTAAVPVAAPPVEPPTTNSIRETPNNVAVVQQATAVENSPLELPRLIEVAKVEPDITAAVIPAPAGPSWDIDVRSYEGTVPVARYLSRFTGPAHDYIQTRLSDGTKFEPMIRTALRSGGIPEDMYYLALVESGFDPNAYSRAAAVGMWQFMASTARGMGLRVDWWIDERRDPVRSTKAAVEFIRGLRDQFGSIYLAAAAYNGGPGRIARGLTRYADDLDGTAGDDLFFALADRKYLKNETREYVPQIIAAALIAKNPAKYGMEISVRSLFAYDSASVPSLTSLAAIAASAGCSIGDLKALNPQILRGTTPPGAETIVRIPAGSSSHFDSAFATIPDSARAGARVVRTKGGETSEKLAKLTGVRAGRIDAFNRKLRKTKSGKYIADQIIYVPTAEAIAAATSVPDPSIERWGTSGSGTHVVRKGETLGLIAKHYNTSAEALMRLNGLKKSIIFPGQQILISRGRSKKSTRG